MIKYKFLTHPIVQITSFFCIIFYGQTIPFFYFLTFISGIINNRYYAIFAITGTFLLFANIFIKKNMIQILATLSFLLSLFLFLISTNAKLYSERLNNKYTLITLLIFLLIEIISIYYSSIKRNKIN